MHKVVDQEQWDDLVFKYRGHPLQLWAWGELKTESGVWTATRMLIQDGEEIIGGAQILTRKLPSPFGAMHYVPRGPFCKPSHREKVLAELVNWGREQKGVALKIEPDWIKHKDKNSIHMKSWKLSSNRVLLARTLHLDLELSEDELLSKMNKKTRQYIRKSEKDGVSVRRIMIDSDKDLKKVLKIYHETAKRDNFNLHGDEYYLGLARLCGDHNQIWLAEKDGRPLAFLWNLMTPANCFELYGGVNQEGQSLRANYILKWQAIRFAKENGAHVYDLNGLLNDGISNFKMGFSDHESWLVGTYDLPLSPMYFIWEKVLPLGKKVVQKRKLK